MEARCRPVTALRKLGASRDADPNEPVRKVAWKQQIAAFQPRVAAYHRGALQSLGTAPPWSQRIGINQLRVGARDSSEAYGAVRHFPAVNDGLAVDGHGDRTGASRTGKGAVKLGCHVLALDRRAAAVGGARQRRAVAR